MGEAFFQPKPFFATDDILVLKPNENKFRRFNEKIALFICTVIKLERFRFHYSRKWNIERMMKSEIYLPSKGSKPDCTFMERYIGKRRFASQL